MIPCYFSVRVQSSCIVCPKCNDVIDVDRYVDDDADLSNMESNYSQIEKEEYKRYVLFLQSISKGSRQSGGNSYLPESLVLENCFQILQVSQSLFFTYHLHFTLYKIVVLPVKKHVGTTENQSLSLPSTNGECAI